MGTTGIARDPTNLLPNDAQWVAHIENVPAALATPGGSALFAPDKGTSGVVKECLGFGVKDIKQIVACGGGDGSWTFTVIRTQGAINNDALRAAMDLGDPLNNIKSRDYFLAKDNPLFEAVGKYFATRLKEFSFKIDPPPGPRQMTVCQLDAKTLAVADRQIMEKFLESDAQPDYRSRLTTAPTAPPPGTGAYGSPRPGIGGPPPGPTPSPLTPGGAPGTAPAIPPPPTQPRLNRIATHRNCLSKAPRRRQFCRQVRTRHARWAWWSGPGHVRRNGAEGLYVDPNFPDRASQFEGDAQPHGFG